MNQFVINGREYYCWGRLVKVCGLVNAWYESVEDPEAIISDIKSSKHRVNIFTFFQRVPHVVPKYNYYMESYPVSVISLKNYADWWKNCIKKYTRQAVKMSQKKEL